MQKMLKVMAVVGFAAGGVFVFSANSAQTIAAASPAGSLGSSRSLYRAHCATCHGNDGRSNTVKGRKLEADDISGTTDSVAKISRIISNGKGDMPGFRRKLTAAQITSIANYVKTL
ncbi:MAG: cytochrome c [Pyrinomonadaceae bacterium]